jgi:hypothetical protein
MLGYMETPNGSIDDLVDKCAKTTTTSRGFMYTLVRNKWAKGFRLKVEVDHSKLAPGKKYKFVPCTVFRGREWTTAIELPDASPAEITQQCLAIDFIGAFHMYRFDQSTYEHVLDEIVFYKDKSFPAKYVPFNKPEPPQDNSLENRNKWEVWNRKKLQHDQSDSAQYELIYKKLMIFEQTLSAVYQQLKQRMKCTMQSLLHLLIFPSLT